MRVSPVLRLAHRFLGATQTAHRELCPLALASRAQAHELASGVVLNPTLRAHTTYLPYMAARPVAAHTAGARKAGYAASVAWGASLATSAVRYDFLFGWLFYGANLHRRAPDQRREAAADVPEPTPRERQQLRAEASLKWATLPLPALLWASELLLGAGAMAEITVPEQDGLGNNVHSLVKRVDRFREVGLGGLLEGKLIQRAGAAGNAGEVMWLSVALGVRIVLLPGRLANVAVLGSVALLGAVFGLQAEVVAQLIYAVRHHLARRSGHAEAVPMRLALERQQAAVLAGLHHLDDTQLPAPLIASLWRTHRDAGHLTGNLWINAAQRGLAVYGGERQRHINLQGIARTRRRNAAAMKALLAAAKTPFANLADPRPARPAPGPQEQDLRHAVARGVDVHGNGRDPATRAALAPLLESCPRVDEEAQLALL